MKLKIFVIIIVVIVIIVGGFKLLSYYRNSRPVLDEPMAAGKSAADFPEASEDYFKEWVAV